MAPPSPIVTNRPLNGAGKLALEIVVIDSTQVPAPGGGEETGPNPTDRGKSGSKHTLMVDGNGVPLALHTSGSNSSDQVEIIPIVAWTGNGNRPTCLRN